jgi:predicted dithiol-disulfide oxidoreductase (DUF899 family)
MFYCTLWADGFNGTQYFTERKAGFAVVSPDPRMLKRICLSRGWKFRMYSSADTPFIRDMDIKLIKAITGQESLYFTSMMTGRYQG